MRHLTHSPALRRTILGLLLLAVLVTVGAVNAGRAHAGWDFKAPSTAAHTAPQAWDYAPTLAMPPVSVGPVSQVRHWRKVIVGVQPEYQLCVKNRSSMAAQTATDYWDIHGNYALAYEGGPNGCSAYPLDRIIEIQDGARDDVCVHMFYDTTAGGQVTRMIIYRDPAATICWLNQIRRNHYSSVSVGFGLNLLAMGPEASVPCHPDVHVMCEQSYDTVSWPQGWDRNTLSAANQ